MPTSYLLYKTNNVITYIVLSFCLALSAYASTSIFIQISSRNSDFQPSQNLTVLDSALTVI